MKIVSYIHMKAKDFIDGKPLQRCRCIALDDVAEFTLTAEPTADEYKLLTEEGFVQFEPDDIDDMYHFAKKEYLI